MRRLSRIPSFLWVTQLTTSPGTLGVDCLGSSSARSERFFNIMAFNSSKLVSEGLVSTGFVFSTRASAPEPLPVSPFPTSLPSGEEADAANGSSDCLSGRISCRGCRSVCPMLWFETKEILKKNLHLRYTVYIQKRTNYFSNTKAFLKSHLGPSRHCCRVVLIFSNLDGAQLLTDYFPFQPAGLPFV